MPFLRPGDLSTKQRISILNELVRSNETRIDPVVNLEDHMGFGLQENEDGEFNPIHFKTTIATSFWILESIVAYGDASLKRPSSMCVRDYLLSLVRKDNRLNLQLFNYYVETYERARFSNEEFTLSEYKEFVENFKAILTFFVKDRKEQEKKYHHHHHHHRMEESSYKSVRKHTDSTSSILVEKQKQKRKKKQKSGSSRAIQVHNGNSTSPSDLNMET